MSLALQGGFFTMEPPGKPLCFSFYLTLRGLKHSLEDLSCDLLINSLTGTLTFPLRGSEGGSQGLNSQCMATRLKFT